MMQPGRTNCPVDRRRILVRSTLCIVLMLFSHLGFGQVTLRKDSDPGATRKKEGAIGAPGLSFKWSPLHLFYYFPSVQLSMEHKLFKNINLQYDAGWIVNLQNTNP